jgi:hypothetical protein
LLFNLHRDPSERFDLASDRPEVIQAFMNLRNHYLNEVSVAPSQLERVE